MVDNYKKEVKALIEELKSQGISDKNVLESIETVPRCLFVPKDLLREAYSNNPLPVGKGQTISQPYTVAFMLQALELKKGLKVLEVGSASGWNAALIGYIIKPGKVYTTEIIPELAELAKENLKKLKNSEKVIKVILTDGSLGLSKYAPFDRIIVTAACPKIPNSLIEQLSSNGILIAPVGGEFDQEMIRIRKNKDKIEKEDLGSFIFVPLKGKHGWN